MSPPKGLFTTTVRYQPTRVLRNVRCSYTLAALLQTGSSIPPCRLLCYASSTRCPVPTLALLLPVQSSSPPTAQIQYQVSSATTAASTCYAMPIHTMPEFYKISTEVLSGQYCVISAERYRKFVPGSATRYVTAIPVHPNHNVTVRARAYHPHCDPR
eukprot:2718407-Rhodomonas_salina.3